MTTFPALQPGSRAFIPGTYPGATFRTLSGRDSRVRHSNAVVAMQAKAEFPLLSESQLESIRSHYVGQYGGHKPFAVPDEFWSGADTPAGFTPSGYQWRYASKPSIEEITIDTSGAAATLFNVSIELEAVPLTAVVLSGATFNITTTWLPGYKTVSANGATWDVAVSWLPGGSSTWNPGASGIVTTGLILHLDAGNAASYPGTGTTWTDLSGNGNNGTLVNGVGYSSANGGVLTTSGNSDRIEIPIDLRTTTHTIICIAKKVSGGGRVVSSIYNNWLMGWYDEYVDTYFAEGWVNPQPSSVPQTSQWIYYAAVEVPSSDQYSLYKNGVLLFGPSSAGSEGPNGIMLGGWAYSQWANSQIGCLLVYSRALTDAEITQNFNALRGRFGL